jgi:hypothetical protein
MRTEVVARSASHFLTHDEDGWALWGVDQDDDDPLLTFSPDDAGEERARRAFEIRTRETQRVRWLAVVAVASGVTWFVLRVSSELYQRFAVPDDLLLGPPSERSYEVQLWLGALSNIAYSAFSVAAGFFLVAWLHRRWRREG